MKFKNRIPYLLATVSVLVLMCSCTKEEIGTDALDPMSKSFTLQYTVDGSDVLTYAGGTTPAIAHESDVSTLDLLFFDRAAQSKLLGQNALLTTAGNTITSLFPEGIVAGDVGEIFVIANKNNSGGITPALNTFNEGTSRANIMKALCTVPLTTKGFVVSAAPLLMTGSGTPDADGIFRITLQRIAARIDVHFTPDVAAMASLVKVRLVNIRNSAYVMDRANLLPRKGQYDDDFVIEQWKQSLNNRLEYSADSSQAQLYAYPNKYTDEIVGLETGNMTAVQISVNFRESDKYPPKTYAIKIKRNSTQELKGGFRYRINITKIDPDQGSTDVPEGGEDTDIIYGGAEFKQEMWSSGGIGSISSSSGAYISESVLNFNSMGNRIGYPFIVTTKGSFNQGMYTDVKVTKVNDSHSIDNWVRFVDETSLSTAEELVAGIRRYVFFVEPSSSSFRIARFLVVAKDRFGASVSYNFDVVQTATIESEASDILTVTPIGSNGLRYSAPWNYKTLTSWFNGTGADEYVRLNGVPQNRQGIHFSIVSRLALSYTFKVNATKWEIIPDDKITVGNLLFDGKQHVSGYGYSRGAEVKVTAKRGLDETVLANKLTEGWSGGFWIVAKENGVEQRFYIPVFQYGTVGKVLSGDTPPTPLTTPIDPQGTLYSRTDNKWYYYGVANINGTYWLDRNVGASSNGYWTNSEGNENKTSDKLSRGGYFTTAQATGHPNSPCPPGFTVPTQAQCSVLVPLIKYSVNEFGYTKVFYTKTTDNKIVFWPASGTYTLPLSFVGAYIGGMNLADGGSASPNTHAHGSIRCIKI